jgi:hypothetical protein
MGCSFGARAETRGAGSFTVRAGPSFVKVAERFSLEWAE